MWVGYHTPSKPTHSRVGRAGNEGQKTGNGTGSGGSWSRLLVGGRTSVAQAQLGLGRLASTGWLHPRIPVSGGAN